MMVRAPEVDPQTRQFEEQRLKGEIEVEFNTDGSALALDLLHAVREGAIVAIQGDRMAGAISSLPATLFGKAVQVPAGPSMMSHPTRSIPAASRSATSGPSQT